MSRIGKNPISIPAGVKIMLHPDNLVEVKGPKGALTQKVNSELELVLEDASLSLKRPSDSKEHKAQHGLYRALINNMCEGVSKGFELKLELVGVGYKAVAAGNVLELDLGYSHLIYFQVPKEITISAETAKGKAPLVTLSGIDKQLVGQIAAKLRSLRKVEPYKGKGVRFVGEIVRRKAGKAAGKK